MKDFFSKIGSWLFGSFGDKAGAWRITWILVIAGIAFLIFAAIYWG